MNSLSHAWIYPPLAFARVGGSRTPLDSFYWGPSDNAPRGTGKTTLRPAETLDIDEGGNVSSRLPQEIIFKDVQGGRELFRPVCPWFELHGRWIIDGHVVEGPITPDVLSRFGIRLSQLRWTVRLGNRKAFNMTLKKGDIVTGSGSLAGDDAALHPLFGFSQNVPVNEEPLVLEGRPIPLGAVQLSRPSAGIPGLRLRFSPPVGAVYAPTNIRERIASLLDEFPGVPQESNWRELDIPTQCRILNERAAWSNWVLLQNGASDARTVPQLQFAYINGAGATLHSLGLLDDFSDGVISCSIPASGGSVVASARVVVTPPDYAPDRRHVVSLADNLTDRTDRDVAAAFADVPLEELSLEVQDLFQRIWETMGLVNVDAMNTKQDFLTSGRPPYAPPPSSEVLPLTAHARRAHRRISVLEVLEDLFRERSGRVSVGTIDGYERPRSLQDLINAPPRNDGSAGAGNAYRKMPALMRGSDGTPMHLTRRQYDLLQLWIARLS